MIYIPTFLSPSNATRDFSANQAFTAQINGTSCTDYQIVIRKISDNSTVLDTTKTHLTTPLYDKQTLTHTITAATIANNQLLKWQLTVWEGSSYVSTKENPFNAYTNPTVALTPPATITVQEYDFVATYVHTQSIGIKKFKFILYDNNNIIKQDSGYFYNANVHFLFSGFLNSTTYKVECIVEDQNSITVSSGVKTFSVAYASPSVTIVPTATLYPEKNAIKINWESAIQITGVPTGTYSFIENFIVANNRGLQIDSNSTLQYTLTIPNDSSIKFKIQLPSGFIGVFVSLGTTYQVGYEDGRFYFNNGGTKIYDIPRSIPTTAFYVIIRPTNVVIKTNTYTSILQV